MNTTDPVLDRIENAERMLRTARMEHSRGNTEDAAEFLAAARRNIDRAAEAMKADATKTVVIKDHQIGPGEKGLLEIVTHRKGVARAR